MRILMDTHIWLWFANASKELLRSEIQDIKNSYESATLYLSAISIWEAALLYKCGKISLHQPFIPWLAAATDELNVIPLDSKIAVESVFLPNFEHKDPADRIIIATARVHNLKIITHDKVMLKYIKSGYAI